MNEKVYDVLVVGSGGAGLTAAITAKQNNKDVLVVSKAYPTHAQTSQAQGGINCAINEEDIQLHIEDTLKSAQSVASKEAITLMCSKAPETIKWLDEIGVPFSRTEEGNIKQRSLGGARNPRACFSSDYTGLKILHSLYDTCIKLKVPFLNEMMVINLIVEDNCVKGITILDIQTGELKALFAKKVILATGGYGGLYLGHTTNGAGSSGDGVAIASRAGCKLSNMEFVQFHPTAMIGSSILISESARGEGGYLIDQHGKRFVDELKPRDVVARAIFQKKLDGDHVYLDLRHLGYEKIQELMPQERELAIKFANIKLEEEPLEVAPAAHYSMGGIHTNLNCETNIKNLYAVGECADVKVHGANRLGGNSLLEIVTFGKIAGDQALIDSDFTVSDTSSQLQEDSLMIDNILKKDADENFYDIRKSLAKVMYKDVGLFRDQRGLDEAYDVIVSLQGKLKQTAPSDKSKIYNKALVDFLQVQNSLEVAKKVVSAAQNRKESLGAHTRVDS
jgi:succinate dehydrogenase/fumarate reductase flavoprotein subunit